MERSGRREHLFVVRTWQEPSHAAPPGQWRGSVEHVPSGQRAYFMTLDELDAFILRHLHATACECPSAK